MHTIFLKIDFSRGVKKMRVKYTWQLLEKEKELVRAMLIKKGYGEDMPLKQALKIAIDFKEKNIINILMKYV